MVTIKEFQQQAVELIKQIDDKHRGQHDKETTIIHLTEELGEIARQIYNEKIGRDKLDKENMKEEIADCMLLLAQLAHTCDIDIEESIDNKIQELKRRHELP